MLIHLFRYYMTFKKLGLSDPIVRAVHDKGYQGPSPIQDRAIPAILKGGDLMASAQTGTGKTAGFTLPMLEILNRKRSHTSKSPRALILAPTRELAAQIHEAITFYGQYTPLRSTMVYGGVKINPQIQALRKGIDILVATPGRLLDLCQQRAVELNQVEMLILDEADRMLDMGFIHDIKKILALLPKERQNLLFSATFSDSFKKFAKTLLKSPVEINVAPKVITAESVQHKIHPVDKAKKADLLSHLIQKNGWFQALVFSRTKHGANKLVKRLALDDIRAVAIHGNKSQSQRTKALESFKSGSVQILVATDVAARGIDIEQLPQVVNFDLPNIPEDYVHRIGRTGRAGSEGKAISLVSADEIKQLQDIEKVLKRCIKREFIDGFEPMHALPTSAPVHVAARKPKSSPAGKHADKRTRPTKRSESKPGAKAKPSSKGRKPTSKKKPTRSQATSRATVRD